MTWLGAHGQASHCLASCNDGQCRDIEKTAFSERTEMQALNDRLAAYVTRVRQMRAQPQSVPSGYHEAVQGLETELANLNGFYQAEINRLRSLLEGATGQKSSLAARVEQMTMVNSEHQARFTEEAARAQALAAELERMRTAYAQVQKELTDMRNTLQARDTEFSNLRPTLERLQRENADLRCKVESEMALRIQVIEGERLASNRLQFDGQARNQMVQDLENRLRASNEIIVGLETRINQMTQTDTHDVSALIKKLREGTATELQRYQRETEGALNRSLNLLRSQIEDESRVKNAIGREKTELEAQVQQQAAVILDLEAKVSALTLQRLAAEKALGSERERSQAAVGDVERRLRDLQCSAMCKVQECTAARDAQLGLKAEIDTFKSVIENEELQLAQVAVAPPVMTSFSSGGRHIRKSFVPCPPVGPVTQTVRFERPGTATSQRYMYGNQAPDSHLTYSGSCNVDTTKVSYGGWTPAQQTPYVSIDVNPYLSTKCGGNIKSGVSGALRW